MPHSFAYFANEWALRAAVVSKRFHRTSFDLQRPLLKVHSYQTRIAAPVRPKKLVHIQWSEKHIGDVKRSSQELERESI